MKKIKIGIAIFSIVMLAIIVMAISICVYKKSLTKGGETALTVFDVDSRKVIITYCDKSVCLIGEERAQFVQMIKNVCKGNSVEDIENIVYDIEIDFANGYTARISTEEKLFLFEGELKSLTDENMKDIFGYFE